MKVYFLDRARRHHHDAGGLDLPARQPDVLPAGDRATCRATGSAASRVESQEWWTPGSPAVRRAEHRRRGDADQVQRRGAHRDDARRSPTTCCRSTRPTTGRSATADGGLDQRRRPDRDPAPAQGPGRHGHHERDRDHEPRAEAGLHGLRDLHLRPERAARLRLPEAEREAGRVHRPADLGLRQPAASRAARSSAPCSGSTTCSTRRASSCATWSASARCRSSARGTRLGEDVPGDEAAGERGIPFRNDRNLEMCFPENFVPKCPGQPVFP